jgi:hypothetical protein
MKKTLYLTLALFSLGKIVAQQHYCAQHKAQYINKRMSAALPPGYVPPESNYDLKFYKLNLNVERNTTFISGNVLSKAKVVFYYIKISRSIRYT